MPLAGGEKIMKTARAQQQLRLQEMYAWNISVCMEQQKQQQ
jgi:hypothetical protein